MPYPDTAKTASLPKGAPYLKQGRSSVADIRFRFLTARCRLTRYVAVEGEVVLSEVWLWFHQGLHRGFEETH